MTKQNKNSVRDYSNAVLVRSEAFQLTEIPYIKQLSVFINSYSVSAICVKELHILIMMYCVSDRVMTFY